MTQKISDLVDVTSNELDEIILEGEGCLKINVSSEFKELTIKKLINKKTNPQVFKYDFLITSQKGKDALPETGLPGEDGKNGGEITINVLDLIDDVNIFIKGANGGNGGSGHPDEKIGGDGGNGGNGADGAKVLFYYAHPSSRAHGSPKIYANEGGLGGNGGNGGVCTDPIGRGETSKSDSTKGGINGNGGKKGLSGNPGTFEKKLLQDPTNLIKPLNLNDDEDYNYFIKHFGSEDTLKKYPKIWNIIQNKKQGKINSENDTIEIEYDDSYTRVLLLKEDLTKKNKRGLQRSDASFYNFQINTQINACSCKFDDSQEIKTKKSKYEPIFCTRQIKIYSNEEIIANYPPEYFDINDGSVSDIIDTDFFPAHQVLNKPLKMEICYLFNNGDALVRTYNVESDTVVFYNYTKLEQPMYNFSGQAPGKKSGNIRFLYGREPTQNEMYKGDSDYIYNGKDITIRDQYNNVKVLKTIIPIKGTIYFEKNSNLIFQRIEIVPYVEEYGKIGYKKPYLFYASNEDESDITYIATMAAQKYNLNTDLAKYLESIKAITIEPSSIKNPDDIKDLKINFDFFLEEDLKECNDQVKKYDWQCQITDATFLDEKFVYNTCKLNACIVFRIYYNRLDVNGNIICDKDNQPILFKFDQQISITSKEKLTDDYKYFESKTHHPVVYIPALTICWGCYATDTLIKTINGVKKACEIQIGDKLPTYSGKILTVSQIYVGEDKQICKIKTIDNKSIRVSGSHAMKLYSENKPDGKKISAGRIKKGDILMTPNGNVEVTSAEIEAYNDKVYNFEFAEEKVPNYIEANGFWSGDFKAQNEPEQRELTPEQKEIRAEMKQLAAELSQKAQQ